MKNAAIYFFLLGLWAMGIPTGNAQELFAGDWHGVADLGMQKMRISFELKLENETWSGIMVSPDQDNWTVELDSVLIKESEIRMVVGSINLSYSGTYNATNQRIVGKVEQRGKSYDCELGRSVISSAYNRPQTPLPPFPYYTEELSFQGGAQNVTLSGTLCLPIADKQAPVAVFITGSGPQDRDETIAGHKPFLVIADHLAKKGFGSLRYDDRGVAKSSGDHQSATSEDFARDAAAAVNYLRSKGFEKIGLIGHSEGGMVAAMASTFEPVDFIISLAGTGVKGYEVLKKQNVDISIAEGLPPSDAIENNRKFMEMVDICLLAADSATADLAINAYLDSAYAAESSLIPNFDDWKEQQVRSINNPWMLYFLNFDPCDSWSKVSCPVLALNGSKDLQVDQQMNFNAIQNCLIKANNFDFTLTSVASANHLFQVSETGRVSEYGDLEESFSPQALNLIAGWLDAHFVDK